MRCAGQDTTERDVGGRRRGARHSSDDDGPQADDDHRLPLHLRVQLVPFFGDKPLGEIGRGEVERFIATKIEAGKSPKSVLNWLRLLSSVFEYAIKREWVQANPCRLVDKPRVEQDEDIRFLTQPEVEALLRKVPDDDLGPTERVLYLAATMTGLRQGELRALRWQDIDWLASRVRVRRNYVRGEYGTPKSRRSTRSIPLADRLAGNWSTTTSGRPSRATMTSCSATRTPAIQSITRRSSSGSKTHLAPQSYGR